MNLSPNEVEELIRNGYNILQETWDEIFRLEEQNRSNYVSIDFSKDSLTKHVDELQKNLSIINFNKNDNTSQPLSSKLKNIGSTTRKFSFNDEESLSEIEEDNQTELFNETQFLKDYYKINALRPIAKVEPGRLPFRHDQFRKMEQYRKEWENNPVPGEKSYRVEREEIRNRMKQKNVPRLQVVKNRKLPEKKSEFRI